MPARAQRSIAATEPYVPGPGLPRPAPKKVATVQAHSVRVVGWFLGGAAGVVAELFVVTIALPTHLTEIFEDFGIEDG